MAPNSYVVTVTSLLLVLPLVSSALEHALAEKKKKPSHYLSKWFVFWPVGMRLGLAGIQQVRKPEFTLVEIFGIINPSGLPIVRELGMANLAMGSLGVASLFVKEWVAAAAQVGGLYYFQAGLGHTHSLHRGDKETFAMWTDFAISGVLALIFAGKVLD